MENLFPLFFVLYVIGSVISAVRKRQKAELERRELLPTTPRVEPADPPRLDPEPAPVPELMQEERPSEWTQAEHADGVPSVGPEWSALGEDRERMWEETPREEPYGVPWVEALDALREPKELEDAETLPVDLDARRPAAVVSARRHSDLTLRPADVRRGILLAEVLGLPRALRPYAPPKTEAVTRVR